VRVDTSLCAGLRGKGGAGDPDLNRKYYDGAEAAAPQPIYKKVPHVPYTMADYLAEVAELFRGHEVLRDYAAALGARIVNRTRGSMIDAYERNPE